MKSIDSEDTYGLIEPAILYFPPPFRKGVKSYSKDKTKNYNDGFMTKRSVNHLTPTIIMTKPIEIIDPNKIYQSDENIKKCRSHKNPNFIKNSNAKNNNNNIEPNQKNIQNNLNVIEQPKTDFQNIIENSDNNKSCSENNLVKVSEIRASKNNSNQNLISSKKNPPQLNLSKALMNINENENEKESHRPKKETNQKSKKYQIKKKKSSRNYNIKKKLFLIDPTTLISKRKQSCCLKTQNEVKNPFYVKIINDLKRTKDKFKLKNISNKIDFINKEIFRIKVSKNKDQKKSNNEENSDSGSIISDDENSTTSRKKKQLPKNTITENNNNINSKKEKTLKNKHDKEKEKLAVLNTTPENKEDSKKINKPKITIIISKNNYINNDKDKEDEAVHTHRHQKKANKETEVVKVRKKKRSTTLKNKITLEDKKKKSSTNQKIHSTNLMGKIKGIKSFNLKTTRKNDEKIGEESNSEDSNDKNNKMPLKKLNKKNKKRDSIKKEPKIDDSLVDSFYFPKD